MQYIQDNLVSRWVGYFDLLGTSDLIRSGKLLNAFNNYLDAVEQLERWKKDKPNISFAWFSDTFILFTDDDSIKSFSDIEKACRWFMFVLLRRTIPIRGALACGQFYAGKTSSLYIGPALLEAYEWGENQNWIGYLLCPSSVNKLSELGFPIENRLNYALYTVQKETQY